MGLEVRIGTINEVAEKFEEVFNSPPPVHGFIAIAENDGELVGFACLQPIWHIEPMWIDPRWRGRRGVFQRLLGLLAPCLPLNAQVVLCFVEQGKLGRFLKRVGMEAMTTWQMYRWLRR